MKGRLKHSNLDYNAKHPILLILKHPVVQLLLEKAHRDNLHEGTEYVRNMLKKEYWIIGIRKALRKMNLRFIKCRHRNANPTHPPMADLPRERLDEHVFPFTHTGVDYFGPFEVKFLQRTLKGWCCLFTCLTTRAVHIEVAVIGHRVMSSCCDKIHCKTWLPKHHHQQQRKKIRWSSQRAESIHERVGKKLRLKVT